MFIKIFLNSEKYYSDLLESNYFNNFYGPSYRWGDFKLYFSKNKYHNSFGPAIIYSTGEISYYLNDKEYLYEDWIENKKRLEYVY